MSRQCVATPDERELIPRKFREPLRLLAWAQQGEFRLLLPLPPETLPRRSDRFTMRARVRLRGPGQHRHRCMQVAVWIERTTRSRPGGCNEGNQDEACMRGRGADCVVGLRMAAGVCDAVVGGNEVGARAKGKGANRGQGERGKTPDGAFGPARAARPDRAEDRPATWRTEISRGDGGQCADDESFTSCNLRGF